MAERQLVASPGEVLEAEEVDDEVQQYLERSSANTSVRPPLLMLLSFLPPRLVFS